MTEEAGSGGGGGMLAPLRRRPFRLLFSGQVVSNLGDWLDFLALIVIIAYTWHHGAAYLAALAIVIAAPWVLVAPVAGVLVERWPKRAVLVGSDLARAAIVLGFVFAPNVYVLLTLVFAKTVFSALFTPAEQSVIRGTVPDEELLAANSLAQLALQGTKVAGPALGGLIVSFSSPRVAFGIDAASFLVSAAILTQLPAFVAPTTEEEEAPGSFWQQFREGFSYMARRPALLVAIGSISAAVFLVFTFDTLSPLALRSLGLGASLLGLAIAGVGLGAVVGAIFLGQLGGGLNPFTLMGGGKIVAGGLVALLGVATVTNLDVAPAVWIPVVLGIGVASAGILVSYPTILQKETPPEYMARVSATATSVPTVLQLVAPIVGAAVAEWVGVGYVLAGAGAGLVVLGAAVLAYSPAVGVGVPAGKFAAEGPWLDSAEPDVVGYVAEIEEVAPAEPPTLPDWAPGLVITNPRRRL